MTKIIAKSLTIAQMLADEVKLHFFPPHKIFMNENCLRMSLTLGGVSLE